MDRRSGIDPIDPKTALLLIFIALCIGLTTYIALKSSRNPEMKLDGANAFIQLIDLPLQGDPSRQPVQKYECECKCKRGPCPGMMGKKSIDEKTEGRGDQDGRNTHLRNEDR